jgi:subtilisin family serine protease
MALSSLHGPDLRRGERGDRWVHTRQRTTQATAVVSGAAALVQQQHPTWTNNQVKALLTGTTTKLKVGPQPDTALAKGTLTLSMKQGRLGD